MAVAVLLLAVATLYAFSTWASIKIVDRYNTRNTMGAAIACGAVFGTIIAFAGVLFGLVPLAGLLFVFVIYYDLGFVRAFVTIIVMGIILQVLGSILVDILGDLDEGTAGIWGAVIIGGIVTAFALRKKGVIGGTPEQQFEKFDKKRRNEQMPKARAKIKPTAKREPVADAQREPVADAQPAPSRPAEPAREVAPQPEPSSLDDGPTFLR